MEEQNGIAPKSDNRHEITRVSQKGVIYHPEKDAFLIVKIAGTGGFFASHYGVWDLPGGHVSAGEDFDEALLREIREEIGEVKTDAWILADRMALEYPERKILHLGFVSRYLSGEIVLSSEHEDYRWMTLEEIEKSDECGEWLKRFVKSAADRLKEHEHLDDAKRIFADFENYRRRQEERVKELSMICSERFAQDLIPVVDNFRAASVHVPEESRNGSWMTGITYIGKQLDAVLEEHGIVSFEAKEGEMFDPYLHEAIGRKDGEESSEGGRIAEVLQPGYKMGARVIRPAKVLVG